MPYRTEYIRTFFIYTYIHRKYTKKCISSHCNVASYVSLFGPKQAVSGFLHGVRCVVVAITHTYMWSWKINNLYILHNDCVSSVEWFPTLAAGSVSASWQRFLTGCRNQTNTVIWNFKYEAAERGMSWSKMDQRIRRCASRKTYMIYGPSSPTTISTNSTKTPQYVVGGDSTQTVSSHLRLETSPKKQATWCRFFSTLKILHIFLVEKAVCLTLLLKCL